MRIMVPALVYPPAMDLFNLNLSSIIIAISTGYQ